MPQGAGYGYQLSADIYVASNDLDNSLPDQAANIPLVERDALPANFLSHAVRSSIPLTSHLTTHLHPSVPRELTPTTICPFLARHLHWRAFNAGAGNRDEIPIRDIPIRVWVTQTEVTELRGGIRTRGKPKIIWDATAGKAGGLQKGELPQVEPKSSN